MKENIVLFFGFIVAFAIILGIAYLWGLWRYNSKIRKHLRHRLEGLIPLKNGLRRGPGRWVLFFFTWAVIFVLLAAASYFQFGDLLRTALMEGGVFKPVLVAMRNSALTMMFPGFHIIPWGVISTTVIGAAVGWLTGTYFAKRQVTKGIYLTSKLA